MEFNEKLQELRKQKGMTQEELAQALFVSRAAVSKWESGRGYPAIDSLKAISVYFGVSVDALLSGEEVLNLAQEDSRQQRNRFRELVFGLLDISTVLCAVLPLFCERSDGAVRAVSLWQMRGYLMFAYWAFVLGMILWGIGRLVLRNCQHPLWVSSGDRVALLFHGAGVLLFILSLQPYGAAFLFLLLGMKLYLKKA